MSSNPVRRLELAPNPVVAANGAAANGPAAADGAVANGPAAADGAAANGAERKAPEAADFLGTVNPCTLCAPLGASLATTGVRNAVSLLHGAQGCATYIRRYLISHFREPVDIASSSFDESQTVFGGEKNLFRAIDNITKQYSPEVVTVATTCLAETIGEDVPMLLRRYASEHPTAPFLVHASTPSYEQGHIEGFHSMVRSMVTALVDRTGGDRLPVVNVLPPMVSPADLRHLREIVMGFGLGATILPDYSDTLDGVILDRYRPLAEGGTSRDDIAAMGRSLATVDFTLTGRAARASAVLAECGAPAHLLTLPVGLGATDDLVDRLEAVSGRTAPEWLVRERGRLLDAYADGHKYVFGKRVAIYGDPELVVGLARFVLEIGARPVLCATGARNRALSPALAELRSDAIEEVLDDTDFARIEAACTRCHPDIVLGSSKGYRMARQLGVPIVRLGFPIHDRIGAARILHLGYRGTGALFDMFVNTLMERQQAASPVGFSYL